MACALKDGGNCHAEMAEGRRREAGGKGVKVGEEEVKGRGMINLVLSHTPPLRPTNPRDPQKVLATSNSHYLGLSPEVSLTLPLIVSGSADTCL